MQSEAGAAGALHGALQTGALATTFTASQGLLLMLPNMFKIAGELTPAVIHVAARSDRHACVVDLRRSQRRDGRAVDRLRHAVLRARSRKHTTSPLVSHAATLRTRVPFLHFFDGFRTSHEINSVDLLDDDDAAVARERRATSPPTGCAGSARPHPSVRGTAQNPDVFFQGREAANPIYDAVPASSAIVFDELAERTGRQYGLVDYEGAADAERVIVMMGSGAGATGEAVAKLVADGERVGLLTIRLFRPFPIDAFLDALPASVRSGRRPRPDEGTGFCRRAAVPGRGDDAAPRPIARSR